MKVSSNIFRCKFHEFISKLAIVAISLLLFVSFVGCESKSKANNTETSKIEASKAEADVIAVASAVDMSVPLEQGTAGYSDGRLGKTELSVDYLEIKRVEEFTKEFFETLVSGDYETADDYIEIPIFYRNGAPSGVVRAYFDRLSFGEISYINSSEADGFAIQHNLHVYVSVVDIHKIFNDNRAEIARYEADGSLGGYELDELLVSYFSDANAPMMAGFANVYVINFNDKLMMESTVFDDFGIRF